MANIIWRCERLSDMDVKYAARETHAAILENKGYICTLAPDLDPSTLDIWNNNEDAVA